ncbi:MAG: secondary thiamine-phosphate synthase enzyme YjbQ [Candidatus Thermoplasmatota archaeon]
MAEEIRVSTKGEGEMLNITERVQRVVSASGVMEGVACAFVVGSTAALTTIEFEPGLVEDMRSAAERLFPRGMDYEHHRRWGDGNGHSHVRAAFIGPSLCIPIANCRLALGTWQQIVLLEYDIKPRERRVIVQVLASAQGKKGTG